MLVHALLVAALASAPAPGAPQAAGPSVQPTATVPSAGGAGSRRAVQALERSASLLDLVDREEDGGLGATLEAAPPAWSAGSLPLYAGPKGSVVAAPLSIALPGSPRLFEVTVEVTGSGYKEKFLLQLPAHPSAFQPAPLLVAFHKFGSTHNDILKSTDFPAECGRRGWFLLAPLGASTKSFSSIPSQLNTELVLDLVLDRFGPWLDAERIYGVGFSMGGGNALNYAARHLDPRRATFAALVNHSGGLSLAHTYEHDAPARWILEYWFGGDPGTQAFEYRRSSLIEFDSATLVVDAEHDLARNLVHVPILAVRAGADPLTYALVQNEVFEAHFAGLGGELTADVTPGLAEHSWNTLDAVAALDWLAGHRLELPDAASTLADRDGRFFAFDVEQDAPQSFTPFDWSVSQRDNRLALTATSNLARIAFDPRELGLSLERPLEIVLATADGSSDEVVLEGMPAQPTSVARDGSTTSAWSHDGAAQTLSLGESDGGMHTWVVVP